MGTQEKAQKKANNKGRQGKAHNLTRKGTKAGNIKRYKGREENVSEAGKERHKGRPGNGTKAG